MRGGNTEEHSVLESSWKHGAAIQRHCPANLPQQIYQPTQNLQGELCHSH